MEPAPRLMSRFRNCNHPVRKIDCPQSAFCRPTILSRCTTPELMSGVMYFLPARKPVGSDARSQWFCFLPEKFRSAHRLC